MLRPIRTILALDGGGIRGLISAVWLERIEREIGPLRERFDLIAGTSAGAINACALVKGLPASKLVSLYEQRGRAIFPGTGSRLMSRFGRLFSQGLSAPKYSDAGLAKTLRDELGKTVLGELDSKGPRLLVPTYDVVGRQAVVIKSHDERYEELPLWEVAKASASAPTYFPAHRLVTREPTARVQRALIDGGVVANNPTACAIAEAVRINSAIEGRADTNDLLVVSVGTGRPPNDVSAGQAEDWGIAQWAPSLVGIFMGGSDEAVHYVASQLLSSTRYIRMQVDIPGRMSPLDDASESNIRDLKRRANEELDWGPVRHAIAAVRHALASKVA